MAWDVAGCQRLEHPLADLELRLHAEEGKGRYASATTRPRRGAHPRRSSGVSLVHFHQHHQLKKQRRSLARIASQDVEIPPCHQLDRTTASTLAPPHAGTPPAQPTTSTSPVAKDFPDPSVNAWTSPLFVQPRASGFLRFGLQRWLGGVALLRAALHCEHEDACVVLFSCRAGGLG